MRRSQVVVAVLCLGSAASAQCPAWLGPLDRRNEILLLFPTGDDASFPDQTYSGTTHTKAQDFDIAGLDSSMKLVSGGAIVATEDDLIEGIVASVREDFCEFDAAVSFDRVPYSSLPAATKPRQVLAVSSAMNTTLYGLSGYGAANHARIWGGTCKEFCMSSPPGTGPLDGTNSTMERWANCIAGVTSHEAGHNYGLWHDHAMPKTGESHLDHIMSTTVCSLCGTPCMCCVKCADRVTHNRRFNDTSYELLAAEIGLLTQTLHNWDFKNPNTKDATRLDLEVLSEETTLTLLWTYSGFACPWSTPAVIDPDPTAPLSEQKRTVAGITYNIFKLRWSSGAPWSGGPTGTVPGGVTFHTGASFTSTKAVVVGKATLYDSTGNDLTLSPRMVGYDNGSLSPTSPCLFDMTFFNAAEEPAELCLSDIKVRFLPRMASIESMTEESIDSPVTRDGVPIVPYLTLTFPDQCLESGESTYAITLRSLADPRFLDMPAVMGGGGGDTTGPPGLPQPPRGRKVSLFPSTYVYVTATVTDTSNDPSHLFYQFAGRRPDCNENGADDALDIDSGESLDTNVNGMPDECEMAPFLRGDVDLDSDLTIGDPIIVLNYLFKGGAPPSCLDAADASDAGRIDVSSPIYLLNYLFVDGPPPPDPFPICGPDPTEDGLGCVDGGCP